MAKKGVIDIPNGMRPMLVSHSRMVIFTEYPPPPINTSPSSRMARSIMCIHSYLQEQCGSFQARMMMAEVIEIEVYPFHFENLVMYPLCESRCLNPDEDNDDDDHCFKM